MIYGDLADTFVSVELTGPIMRAGRPRPVLGGADPPKSRAGSGEPYDDLAPADNPSSSTRIAITYRE